MVQALHVHDLIEFRFGGQQLVQAVSLTCHYSWQLRKDVVICKLVAGAVLVVGHESILISRSDVFKQCF